MDLDMPDEYDCRLAAEMPRGAYLQVSGPQPLVRSPLRWRSLSVMIAPLMAVLLLSSCTVPAGALAGSGEPWGHQVASLLQRQYRLEAETQLFLARDSETHEEQESLKDMGSWPKLELTRFVTPYGTELEAIVDITPYSHALESVLETFGSAGFYVTIDTWVGNNTEEKVLYVNNETGQCTALKTSSGNGWNVSVELLVWPQSASAAGDDLSVVRPRATVVLAEGHPGTFPRFGEISVHEGSLQADSGMVNLSEAADLGTTALDSAVYMCPDGAAQLQRDAFMGFVSRQAELLVTEAHGGNDSNKSASLQNLTHQLEKEILEYLVVGDMVQGSVKQVSKDASIALEVVLGQPAQLRPDMPVYYSSGGAISDEQMSSGRWINMSLPFEPFGFITKVFNRTHFAMNVSSQVCFASVNDSTKLPEVRVPKNPHILEEAMMQVKAATQRGLAIGFLRHEVSAGSALQEADGVESGILFLHNNDTDFLGEVKLVERQPIGHVAKDSGHNASAANASLATDAASKVCVVKAEHQGRMLNRRFNTSLHEGERALLQLTVTGHGWASTTEQCGEYCHAVYHLRLNNHNFANVTEWRDDCRHNPTGFMQHGTWEESRNGWCPGSVEPGVFIDVTEFLSQSLEKDGNSLELDVTVWSNMTHRYMPYTDYGGYVLGDKANLAIAMNILIYDPDTVASARSMEKALTKAEAALREGSSDPFALRPPAVVRNLAEESLLQASPKQRSRAQGRGAGASPAESVGDDVTTEVIGHTALGHRRALPDNRSYDFEGRAPWYFYNMSTDGRPGARSGGVLVPVFQDRLMQSNSRTLETLVSKEDMATRAGPASAWRQVAVRLRLRKPTVGKLEIDHWDRVGSFGLMLPMDLPGVEVRTKEKPPQLHKLWKMK